MTNAILRGKPDAGNPRVRFDEGEVASAKPRRGSLLYNKRQQLWEMMRNDVSEDEDDFEWPDWAKDWPRDVTNFWLDQDGVHWGYWAGEIFAGCNGHMTISLTWDQLKPIVRKDFIVPSK